MGKYPTINGTLRAIQAMGLTAKWSVEWQEFKITAPNGETYHTDSRHDALFTAREMAKHDGKGKAN